MRDDQAFHTGAKSPAAALALFLVSSALSAAAVGQQLGDPMAPPGARTAGASSAAVIAGAAPATGLQGVISGPRRKLALVDGVIVPLGGKISDEQVLVGIGVDSVVVREGGERETLEMFPGIEKKRRR